MKTIITSLLTAAGITLTAIAQPQASFSTDTFEGFTLHTYASFDPMADVTFIIEGPTKLVVIEPQAFEGKVEEFMAYTEEIGKPVEKVLVSFHPAGLSVYQDETKVISKPMAGFLKSDASQGMLAYFDKAFNGAMDTAIVEFDEIIEANAEFTVDGVNFKLEPTSLHGMPGVNIAINDEVYYQHFAPAKGTHVSEHLVDSIDGIDAALVDAKKAKKAEYKLLLGSHGFGKGTQEDLKFQINYLKTMKKMASKAKTSDEFIAKMNQKYPDLGGAENLEVIAGKLYQ